MTATLIPLTAPAATVPAQTPVGPSRVLDTLARCVTISATFSSVCRA